MTDRNQPVPDRHYAIGDLPPLADTSHIKKKYFDIAYAPLSPAQKLDIYLPDEGDGPFPIIVSIHGGAFMGCDKADMQVMPMLAGHQRGYAVVAINYRLSGEAKFPALVQDAKAAVRWIRANAAQFGLDPDRIAAWGGSAGGYQASMLGVTAGVPELEDLSLGNPNQPCDIQAAVVWFGPTSCIWPNAPPFFIQHGTRDTMVPALQAVNSAAKLENVITRPIRRHLEQIAAQLMLKADDSPPFPVAGLSSSRS